MIEARIRNQVSQVEVDSREGRMMSPGDYSLIARGPVRLLKPDGRVLAVLLPRYLPEAECEAAYPSLARAAMRVSDNRGTASGTATAVVPGGGTGQHRSTRVRSSIAGSMEATKGRHPYCRLTSFNKHHMADWDAIVPVLQAMGRGMREHQPDRYQAQMAWALQSAPAAEWLIPDTPFTTVTLNHTWATAGHYDNGDLDAGISCLAVLRRGEYRGGLLVVPRYRVAFDLHDRDLLLVDAHELHGNTPLEADCPTCGPVRLGGAKGGPTCSSCGTRLGAERLAIVAYYRTEIVKCGTREQEDERQRAIAEGRNQAHLERA